MAQRKYAWVRDKKTDKPLFVTLITNSKYSGTMLRAIRAAGGKGQAQERARRLARMEARANG